MAMFDAVHANVFRELYRGAQTPEGGHVRTSDSLETLGADCFVVPSFGGDGIPELVNDFIANVEKSRPLRRLKPFMRAGRIHVTAEVVEVEAHHAGDMRTVNGGEN